MTPCLTCEGSGETARGICVICGGKGEVAERQKRMLRLTPRQTYFRGALINTTRKGTKR
jgi:DnaJ-class molecular chaperone